MSWPSPEDVEIKSFRAHRKWNWGLDQETQKKAHLGAIEEQRLASVPKEDPRVAIVLEFMQGEAFAAWYEATTGRDRDRWLDGVFESAAILHHAVSLEFLWQSLLDLIRANRWTNPDTKALWAQELHNLRPSERRRVQLRLATPRWANIDAIMELYIKRYEMTRETGIEYHVDHIVPIQHPRVCGLHCEANLQVITASANCQKSNKFAC